MLLYLVIIYAYTIRKLSYFEAQTALGEYISGNRTYVNVATSAFAVVPLSQIHVREYLAMLNVDVHGIEKMKLLFNFQIFSMCTCMASGMFLL